MGKCYFLALILLMACSQTKETIDNDVETIVINTEATADSTDVSSIIKEIRLVPLEEKENNFLEGVDKILITENYYVLFDRYGSNQINLYDKEGKFIRQVGSKGDGPLEVRQVNDYWLNEEGCLEIYDFSLKKIVVFDDTFQADSAFKTKDLLIFQSVTKLLDHDGYVGFKSYDSYNGPFNNVHYKLGFLDENFRLKNTALNYSSELDGFLITTPINPFETGFN